MPKFKVFISSVQSEFASERLRLYDYIRQDELMNQYFEPFIFEKTAAQDTNPRQLYLDEAAASEVYLALIGQDYGNAADGELSPTEKEYNAAGECNAYRVAFIKDLDEQPREDKEGNVASEESYMASGGSYMATNIASESPNVASEVANIASDVPNIASDVPNIACETSNIASVKQAGAIDYLEANKRLIDSIVAPKVKQRMKPEQIRACIIEACIVEHSTEELAALLHKAPAYLRNFIIPDLITEGILLRTKPRTANGQTYITNPKYR